MSSRFDQAGGQPGGLRIVQEHDVARRDQRADALQVLARDGLVDLALTRAEPATVAGHAVQAIVNPLRDAEELRVAVNHEPAGIDSCAAPVRDQGAEHLGDSPTVAPSS